MNENATLKSLWQTDGPGLVAVDTSWAQEQQLPQSQLSAKNDSQSIYFAAAFHQLHCTVSEACHIIDVVIDTLVDCGSSIAIPLC